MQVQPGPEPNELFSEPRHSIDIGSPDCILIDGRPAGQVGVATDSGNQQPSDRSAAPQHNDRGRTPSGASAGERSEEQSAARHGSDAADPGITRSSTGEDFEASAGPRGRDGCAQAHVILSRLCGRRRNVTTSMQGSSCWRTGHTHANSSTAAILQ